MPYAPYTHVFVYRERERDLHTDIDIDIDIDIRYIYTYRVHQPAHTREVRHSHPRPARRRLLAQRCGDELEAEVGRPGMRDTVVGHCLEPEERASDHLRGGVSYIYINIFVIHCGNILVGPPGMRDTVVGHCLEPEERASDHLRGGGSVTYTLTYLWFTVGIY